MTPPPRPPVWKNITIHLLRHSQGDWWADVWAEAQGAPRVARVPMCHGVGGQELTNEDFIRIMETVRELFSESIAQMIEPF